MPYQKDKVNDETVETKPRKNPNRTNILELKHTYTSQLITHEQIYDQHRIHKVLVQE